MSEQTKSDLCAILDKHTQALEVARETLRTIILSVEALHERCTLLEKRCERIAAAKPKNRLW